MALCYSWIGLIKYESNELDLIWFTKSLDIFELIIEQEIQSSNLKFYIIKDNIYILGNIKKFNNHLSI